MNKINTGNLYMDDLIHDLKILSLNSILKDESEADKYETVNSLKTSNIYIACKENTVQMGAFEHIPIGIMTSLGVPFDIANVASIDPRSLPEEYVPSVREAMIKHYISEYIEENDYYRMLNGLPPLDDIGVISEHSVAGVRTGIPMHELSDDEILLLENAKAMDKIIQDNLEYRYLRYMGSNRVSVYSARKGLDFGLLYCPDIDNKLIRDKYIEYMEKNRIYTLKTIYSEAFKFNSEYYDKFISIFIIIQTIIDIIMESPERIVKREFFDEVSIRDMFISHGIDYFPEIPLRYQLAMIKNLNELLKFKSTTKNLVDICSIFGFDNIEIFKYYLLKDRKIDGSGNYIEPIYGTNEDGVLEPIEESMYELKFVRVPINENPDNYIRDHTNHLGYRDIVNGDEYWYGGKPKDEVDKQIMGQNFNYVISKYISIDTVYEMNKIAFDMSYFINMVFDNRDLYDKLTISITRLSPNAPLTLSDTISFMYAIMYKRIGINDVILDSTKKILHVMGFNFKADLAALYTDLQKDGYSFNDVGISGFSIPIDEALSYNDLLELYTNNRDIHDHILERMGTADNIHTYRLYEKIYRALMVSELHTDQFTKFDGTFAGTYTEYLRNRNRDLHTVLRSLDAMSVTDRNDRINEYMDLCIRGLESNLDDVGFEFFASNINISSVDTIKQYLYKLVNFFKSHTVQLLSSNTSYTMGDRWTNRVNIFDEVYVSTRYNARTLVRHNFTNDKITFASDKSIIKQSDIEMDHRIRIKRIYE